MKNEEDEERNDADVQAEKVDVKMQTDEAEVAAELLREKTNITNAHVPLPSPEPSEPPGWQEPGGRCNNVTKRDENDTTADERERDNKRRRLQVLSSENVILRTLRTVGVGSESLKVNVMLRQLDFDNDTSEHCMDISNLVRAVDDKMSPHEEVKEMVCWRRMFDGYEFYDYARRQEDETRGGHHGKVPRENARLHGCKIITTKWL